MINSWSLLYDEIYGDDEMSDEIKITTDSTFNVGSGSTASTTFVNFDLTDEINNVSIDTSNFSIDTNNYIVDSDGLENDVIYAGDTLGSSGYETLNIDTSGYPSAFTALSDNDDAIAHLIDKPVSSGIEDNSIRKYKEDESIKALQDYISTTYGGHYTSKENNVQTLDLIESVGDAESFCRSNAIKYLSRYDKKGQAKRDILKALHYSLLLYHFSGQLNETTIRGYETF